MSEPPAVEREFRILLEPRTDHTWRPLLVLDGQAAGAVVFACDRQEYVTINGEDYERIGSRHGDYDMPALSQHPSIMNRPEDFEAARRLALLHVKADHEGTEWRLPDVKGPEEAFVRRPEKWAELSSHAGVLADWYEDNGHEAMAEALRFIARPLVAPVRIEVLKP